MVHLEVMDGHFVDDISVGQPVVRSLRKATKLAWTCTCSSNVRNAILLSSLRLGAERISVHPEATARLHHVLDADPTSAGQWREWLLNPATPVETIVDLVGEFDYLSVLSSDPGLSEANLHPQIGGESDERRQLFANERRADFAIQVEGGIRFEHLEQLAQAGADILVAGSAIFNSDDPMSRLREMMRLASALRPTSKA